MGKLLLKYHVEIIIHLLYQLKDIVTLGEEIIKDN
jgi:hypothetical protein